MQLFEQKGMRVLAGVALLALIILIGAQTRNTLKEFDYIGRPNAQRDVISISAEGSVTAIPDIATVSLGVQTEKKSLSDAQRENTEKMNAIMDVLEDFGIEAKDIKTTNYSVHPSYDYFDGQRTLRGYTITQDVQVKIRDLEKVGDVLARATASGANQIGGIGFTVDEPEELEQEARIKALAAAKVKAQALAESAGVKLGGVVGFSEGDMSYPMPVYKSYALDGVGFGGEAAVAPDIQQGSQEIIKYVTVTYEIIP